MAHNRTKILSTYYRNVRGLNTKTSTTKMRIEAANYDIIGFTETWLQDGVNDSEIFPTQPPAKHYNVFRSDRNLALSGKSTGGGVLLATESSLNATRMTNFERQELEMVWLKITLDYILYVCCVYIPNRNDTSSYIAFYENLLDNTAMMEEGAHMLILADFNL